VTKKKFLEPIRSEIAPPKVAITIARSAMGGIDLDPFSCETANKAVLAKNYFDRNKLSLEEACRQDWNVCKDTRVLAFSPFGVPVTTRLFTRCWEAYRAGDIRQAVLITSSNEALCKTPWSWDFPLAFPFRRLRSQWFDPDLEQFFDTYPSTWTYIVFLPPAEPRQFHERLAAFYGICGPIGRVVMNSDSGDITWRQNWETLHKKPYA
jgi:hypothetical protein